MKVISINLLVLYLLYAISYEDNAMSPRNVNAYLTLLMTLTTYRYSPLAFITMADLPKFKMGVSSDL